MHIIIGDEVATKMKEKYIVLELDKIQTDPNSPTISSYCVIDKPLINEISHIEEYVNLHTKLMENYRKQDWNFCKQAIGFLHGRWNSELNSFYDEIFKRVEYYEKFPPGDDWNDGVYKKQVQNQ